MKDISLHLMDIAQNSIVAGADRISISLSVQGDPQMLIFEILDNGKGMDAEFLKKVTDPFKTSRTTRNVGLGIPLLMQSANMAGGELIIQSELGKGTKLQAKFEVKHIDRIPLGDISETIKMLIMANPNISWSIHFTSQKDNFTLDTDELKHHLDGVSIANNNVLEWIQNTITDGIKSVYGGVLDEVN
ncbi:MAG: ATP-binding protein [Acetivibrionales bacterium]|jgi:DNA mismatch repair ATPase MutL|nr:ATP-binding protein [Clostridiaceae bacterium]